MENPLPINVGSTVTLKTSCMGNAKGSTGVCYDVYQLGGRIGYQFIFQNGEYCGFSGREVKQFFEPDYGFEESCSDYQFSNVIQLNRDFESGYFNNVWTNTD